MMWIRFAAYAAVALCLIGVGYGISDTISARKIAVLERNYATERAIAASQTAAAEADARRVEKGWRDYVSLREREVAGEIVIRDQRIADLSLSSRGLQQRIATLSKSGGTAANPAPSGRDIELRLEAFGVLLGEREEMARTYAEDLERTGTVLRLCRGYVEAITK